MKEIPLTRGKVAIVDNEDFERLNKFKWYASQNGNAYYAKRNIFLVNDKLTTIIMHREILDATKGVHVDHRNGDGLDNRKENLRLCTRQQNQFNRTYQKNNNLKTKGVCWYKKLKKFRACINFSNKKIHLGYFNNLNDADSAYRIAEEKYFGEFVRMETRCKNE